MALCTFFLLLAISSLSSGATSEKEIRTESATLADIRAVLERGSNDFSAGESQDIVLVLGKTGMGKSTWTHFIAGDRDLTSLGEPNTEESSEGMDNFFITDGGGGICNETVTSCTSVPELVLDASTDTVFYDCPGFDDTRSAAHDIAATYFIHKVVSSAKRAKIVCVIDFNSVRQGGDRSNFRDTAKNIISMIPQIEKFAGSIYLVVTKVDGRGYSRQEITTTIARFLKETSKALQKGGFNQNADVNESIVKFINILLEKNGKEYSRIGIFRTPSEPGLLSGMKLMEDDRNAMRDSLLYNLTYAPYKPQDFKYVTADRWKHDLMTKKDEINGIIVLGLDQAVVHFQTVFDQFVLNQIEHPNDIEDHDALVAVYQQFFALRSKPLSLDTVFDAIHNACKNLNISTQDKHQITTILEYGQFLEFISIITNQNLLEKSHLDKALTYLIDYVRTQLLELSNTFNTLAINGIENMTIQFGNSYNQLLNDQLDRPDHFDRVINASLEAFEGLLFLQSKAESLTLEELIEGVITNSIILNITTPEQVQLSKYILYYERYIRSLVSVTGDRSALINRSFLVNTLTDVIDYLRTKFGNLSMIFTDRIAVEMEKIGEQFETGYSQLLAVKLERPENFTKVINASGRAYKFFSEIHLTRGSLELSSLMAEVKNTFDNLNISTSKQQQRVDIVVEYGQYIYNLSSVTGHTSLDPSALSDALKYIAHYLKTKLLFLSEIFSEKIALNIDEVAREFNNSCHKLIISQEWVYNDLEKSIATSKTAQEYLSELNHKSLDFEKFLGVITKTMKNLNISIPKQELHTSIVADGEYIQLIEGIVGQNSFNRLILVNTISDLMDRLRGTQQWLEFIEELDKALVSYGVQQNCDKNLILFEKLLHPNRTESILRNEVDETIEKFMENAKRDSDHHNLPVLLSLNRTYVNSKHVVLDELKLRVLVGVLKTDLDTPTTYECEGDKLSIRGSIVRASRVNNELASCSSKNVAVFAESKLFIDEDINATGRNLHLTINASFWEIVGTRRIIVDGSPGHDMTGRPGHLGVCGKEGLTGLPGGDGGSFFGSGKRCLGCSQLTISANGGRGGKGQDGSDGLDGNDGSFPPTPTYYTKADCEEEPTGEIVTKVIATALTYGIISPFVEYHWYCNVQGMRGTEGGKAGPGGAGGDGGLEGIVEIHFADRSEPKISSQHGAKGERGAPGKYGKDGKPGYAYSYKAGTTLFHSFSENITPRELPLDTVNC